MADYSIPENTASGALFWNDDKKNPKAPDARGVIEFDSGLVRILVGLAKLNKPLKLEASVWTRTSAKGTEFMSISLKEEYNRGASMPERQPQREPEKREIRKPVPTQDFDDEIPF